MAKTVAIGVDLGTRPLICTSASPYTFGDECLQSAIEKDYDQAENWIAEQIVEGCKWLYALAEQGKADVVVLEDLKKPLEESRNKKLQLEYRRNILPCLDKNAKIVLEALIKESLV